MRFTVVTLFPELFDSFLHTSLIGKAIASGLFAVDFVNPREFATDRHLTVDDTPFGGGPGMVMKADTLVAAIESAGTGAHRILLAPAGEPLTQARVRELAGLDHIVLVCGRYEGVDERVRELAIDESISIGDYVLTGGEIGAMAIVDAVSRFIPGVLGAEASTDDESFSHGLLEYPQYTRPREFRGLTVPDVLIGGNHRAIDDWRRARALERTAKLRPELAARRGDLDGPLAALAHRTWAILAHYPVYDRHHDVVTTAITNLDLHDVARAAATYGLAEYLIVTPVEAQREKVARIMWAWSDDETDAAPPDLAPGTRRPRPGGQTGSANRRQALAQVIAVPTIAEAVDRIRQATGQDPQLVATSADTDRCPELPRVGFRELVKQRLTEPERPLVLVFGTGWGLTEDALRQANQLLEPIRGPTTFNHLAVRGAVCIILDRLFGTRD